MKKASIVFVVLSTVMIGSCLGQSDNFTFHLIDSLASKIDNGPIATFIVPGEPDEMGLYYYRMILEKQSDDVNLKITKGKEYAKVLPNDSLIFLFAFEDTIYYQKRCSLINFMDTLYAMKRSKKDIEPISIQININGNSIMSGPDRSAQVLRYYVLNHLNIKIQD